MDKSVPTSATVNFPEKEQTQVDKFVNDTRVAYNCSKSQFLMMGIAWVLPCERKLFNMFPEVICVDTTQDTNNEERPLLTISAKDTHGKMFTVLRAYLPNEQTWVFHWVFSNVLPSMFGNSILKHIKMVISDGDSQEYSQLDNAINRFFPSVYRGRCGWHIIEKGWQIHMLGVKSFPVESAAFYYNLVHHLKA